jgi:3-deoxy-alpha-D-manno-octulosonate 8-oxidase
MINVSFGLAPLWENALGKDWKTIMTKERLLALFKKV